jgi:hypothetical protein
LQSLIPKINNQPFGEKMMEKLKEKKLRVAIIVIVAILIFYAAGNATGFFGNPVFKMFWILSNEQAHSVAIYGAIAGAVVVVSIGLTLTRLKKQKIIEPHTTPKSAISPLKQATSSIKSTNQILVEDDTSIIPDPIVASEMNDKKEEYKTEQKNEQIKQPLIPPSEQSEVQKPIIPTIKPTNDQNKTNSQKIDTNKPVNDKLSCPNCKKQFSTPLFMLEYVQSKPKLVGHCPYCDQTLVNVQKDA